MNKVTENKAISGEIVEQQQSSRSLNALSDGASATEGGSLFHGLTTRTANAACHRVSWNRGCSTLKVVYSRRTEKFFQRQVQVIVEKVVGRDQR